LKRKRDRGRFLFCSRSQEMINSLPRNGAVVLSTLRFGAFEVDLAAAELRKGGVRLRLQEQPFQVLAALLEAPGQVVSREELIRRLWPDGTVVDFDRGLNAAVTRLRQVLSDSAETPRYVETVARRGYRFIAPIETTSIEPVAAVPPPAATPPRRRSLVWMWATAVLIVVAGVAGVILYHREPPSSEQPFQVVPLTTELGFEWWPTLSPEGNQVAFQWNKGSGNSHIYVKQVGPGDPVRLTSGSQTEFAPAWSRDGRYIAFMRELDASRTGIFYAPPIGGVEHPIAECPNSYVWKGYMLRRLDWMPDGKNLIVSCPDTPGGSNGLKVIALATGAKSPLTKPLTTPGFGDQEPAVSADGSAVAFLRGQSRGRGRLHWLSLTAELTAAGEPRVLPSMEGAGAPAWMPDGKEIIYDRAGALWRIGLAGGTPRRILELGLGVRQAALDRVHRLAYAMPVSDSNIWRQELTNEGTAARPAAPLITFTTEEMSPDYSPEGTRIAFRSLRSGSPAIWICASDGTRCDRATEISSGSPRWSPTGDRIAFDSDAAGSWDVLVMPANGGQPQRLTDHPASDSQPSWSRDGNSIYFASDRSGRDEVWKVAASGGAAVRVTRNGGFTAFESEDGKLYYNKSDNETKLWRCNLDGTGETLVLNAVSDRAFVVTKDRIYYKRPHSGGGRALMVRYLSTGKEAQISVIPNSDRLGLSLSPDNRYLIYPQVDRE